MFIDPHWPAEGQTSWWEFHVHAGRRQAGGFALPGLPFVGLGYTDGAAWAATAGGADSADVFELKINPKNPDQYWYDGQWRDLVVRDVTIRVKTAAGKVEERPFRMRESVHGPISRRRTAASWPAQCAAPATPPVRTMAGHEPLAVGAGTARRLPDGPGPLAEPHLRHARRTFRLYPVGHVSAAGRRPVQHARRGRRHALEANWQGRIPFDALPQVHDPESGWLQSCNTAANYVTEGHTLRAEDFPPGVVCGHYAPDGRTWRGRGRRCFEAMPTMKTSRSSRPRRSRWTPSPRRADLGRAAAGRLRRAEAPVPDPDLSMKKMADAVRHWDFHVRKDSVGATAFRYWRAEYGKLHPEAFGENEAYGAPKTAAEQLDAVKALRAAADYLKKTFGSPLVPWGRSCGCGAASWICRWTATSASSAASSACGPPAPRTRTSPADSSSAAAR